MFYEYLSGVLEVGKGVHVVGWQYRRWGWSSQPHWFEIYPVKDVRFHLSYLAPLKSPLLLITHRNITTTFFSIWKEKSRKRIRYR